MRVFWVIFYHSASTTCLLTCLKVESGLTLGGNWGCFWGSGAPLGEEMCAELRWPRSVWVAWVLIALRFIRSVVVTKWEKVSLFGQIFHIYHLLSVLVSGVKRNTDSYAMDTYCPCTTHERKSKWCKESNTLLRKKPVHYIAHFCGLFCVRSMW